MRQFSVNISFDKKGEPTVYYTANRAYRWPYEKVESFDWKDVKGQVETLTRLSKQGEVVELFAGDDTVNYALLEDAIRKGKK